MKKNYFIILGGLILLAGVLFFFKWWRWAYPNYYSYEKSISIRCDYNKTSNPDSYKIDCDFENQKKISFPLEKSDYAILHYNKLLKRNKKLSKQQMERILKILNDSSAYIWGELGTPVIDRFITFHDKLGHCIGLTKIDYGGQTWSIPSIAKMKWGLIYNNSEVIEILEQRED